MYSLYIIESGVYMYQVIIQNVSHNDIKFDFRTFRTYNEFRCLCSYFIKSEYSHVFIRKVLKEVTSSWKVISTLSKDFSRLVSAKPDDQKFLSNIWR